MMYKSMQKTLNSEGKEMDDQIMTYNPGSLDQVPGMDLKMYSHQKPQRHLSALHSTTNSSNNNVLHHTPQCMATGANCHLRHGLFPDRQQEGGSIRDKRHTANGQLTLTPCMQALQQ